MLDVKNTVYLRLIRAVFHIFSFFLTTMSKYKVLPSRGFSYVTDENGEPMLTYFRKNSGLFCNTPVSEDDPGFFLNIRRPVVFDVEGVAPIYIPDDLPEECDGIIFLNFGVKKAIAFYVRDYRTQVWKV